MITTKKLNEYVNKIKKIADKRINLSYKNFYFEIGFLIITFLTGLAGVYVDFNAGTVGWAPTVVAFFATLGASYNSYNSKRNEQAQAKYNVDSAYAILKADIDFCDTDDQNCLKEIKTRIDKWAKKIAPKAIL